VIEVKYYRGAAAREAARLAINAHLYIDGWYLLSALAMIQAGQRKDPQIALVFEHDTPVAIAVEEGFNQVMAFCKRSHRRRGLASKAVGLIEMDPKTYADGGIPGSEKFWDAVHVMMRSRHTTEAREF